MLQATPQEGIENLPPMLEFEFALGQGRQLLTAKLSGIKKRPQRLK